MLSYIRRHASFVNVVAVIALVFAMTGGALAAKKYLITSTSQIKPSVLKSLQGKAGPAGAIGQQGPAGAAGPQGPVGPNGTNGINGASGTPGSAGPKGATGMTGKTGEGEVGPKGPTGLAGTTGTTGPAGATGPEGVCSKANCTLPSGQTETGTWVTTAPNYNLASGTFTPLVAVSFPIPLAAPSGEGHAFFFTEKETAKHEFGSTGCTGTVEKPTAPAGTLCVYTEAEEIENGSFNNPGANGEGEAYGVAGSIIFFRATTSGANVKEAFGAWAVTAP